MKVSVAMAVLSFAIAGCATPSTQFASPNGQITRCAAHGWGYVGAPMAQGIHDTCTNDAKATGAIPLAEAGSIGIMGSTDTASLRILKVAPGSPAEQAGIRPGDVIVAVNDQAVGNWVDARAMLFGRKETSVKVTYRSGNAEKTVNIVRYGMTEMMAGMQQ